MRNSSRALSLASLAIVTPFIISTSAGAAATPESTDLESLGSSSSNDQQSTGLEFEVQKAERNDSGNLLSVVWSVENSADEGISLTWLGDRSYTYTGPYFSAVLAVSSDGEKKFHPIMDGNGECICSGRTSAGIVRMINPGEQVSYWTLFSVPDDVDAIDIEAPGFDTVEDIPIS